MNSRMISYFFPYSLFIVCIFFPIYSSFSLFFILLFPLFPFLLAAAFSLSLSLSLSPFSHSPVSLSLPPLFSFFFSTKTTQKHTKFGAKSRGKDKYINPSISLSFLLVCPHLNLSLFGFLGEIRKWRRGEEIGMIQARVLWLE